MGDGEIKYGNVGLKRDNSYLTTILLSHFVMFLQGKAAFYYTLFNEKFATAFVTTISRQLALNLIIPFNGIACDCSSLKSAHG